MTASRATSVDQYALRASFEEVHRRLLEPRCAERLARPLGYWALPKDRRLPYALLNRTVGQLINTSFEDLSSTAGIGRKKIAALLMLLTRVVNHEPYGSGLGRSACDTETNVRRNGGLDPSLVSESMWDRWCETVRRHSLEQEPLGRLAPSLQELPTVLWKTPLSAYLDLETSAIRQLKMHGDKRVRAVFEVFHTLHELLGSVGRTPHLAVRLVPRFLVPVEQWIVEELRRPQVANLQEVRQNLVLPFLNQIELDAGETAHRLVMGRLGVESSAESVQQQAQQLGLTRARIYQLLESCAQIMALRCPEGRWQLAAVSAKLESIPEEDERSQLLRETRALLFPTRPATRVRRTECVASAP